ncbi:MAG TPA: hypothetical protein VJN63_08290 [Thermoplasmata archaeon]|nr:hypothetical protein [Thermoplasmata archaeon]
MAAKAQGTTLAKDKATGARLASARAEARKRRWEREQADRQESKEWWDRGERIAGKLIDTAKDVVVPALAAVGGVVAFQPWAIVPDPDATGSWWSVKKYTESGPTARFEFTLHLSINYPAQIAAGFVGFNGHIPGFVPGAGGDFSWRLNAPTQCTVTVARSYYDDTVVGSVPGDVMAEAERKVRSQMGWMGAGVGVGVYGLARGFSSLLEKVIPG